MTEVQMGRVYGEQDARAAFLAVSHWSDRPALPVPPADHLARIDWMLGYSAGFRAVARQLQSALMQAASL